MIRTLIIAAFTLALAACGSGKVGEACTTAGATTDQCGDDAVCTPEGTSLVCAKLCTQQSDCASDENCNGLTGTLKSCQPK